MRHAAARTTATKSGATRFRYLIQVSLTPDEDKILAQAEAEAAAALLILAVAIPGAQASWRYHQRQGRLSTQQEARQILLDELQVLLEGPLPVLGPEAVLLGERQLVFLDDWAADWSDGTWMKVVLSQTLFANLATLPASETSDANVPILRIVEPGEYPADDRAVADMDSNGWPRSGRDRALRGMRRGFAVHLAGDQHLGSTLQYGVDTWEDAAYALCVPSIANFFPRRWFPPRPGEGLAPGDPRYAGRFEDGFGNRMTVHAVSNPVRTGREPGALHDMAPGYGIARFSRDDRRVSLEAWPRWADPTADEE